MVKEHFREEHFLRRRCRCSDVPVVNWKGPRHMAGLFFRQVQMPFTFDLDPENRLWLTSDGDMIEDDVLTSFSLYSFGPENRARVVVLRPSPRGIQALIERHLEGRPLRLPVPLRHRVYELEIASEAIEAWRQFVAIRRCEVERLIDALHENCCCA